MQIVIVQSDARAPAAKLAEAEIHFDTEPMLEGLKLVGFTVWQSTLGDGEYVTGPSRDYIDREGAKKYFQFLRSVEYLKGQEKENPAIRALKDRVLQAYYDSQSA